MQNCLLITHIFHFHFTMKHKSVDSLLEVHHVLDTTQNNIYLPPVQRPAVWSFAQTGQRCTDHPADGSWVGQPAAECPSTSPPCTPGSPAADLQWHSSATPPCWPRPHSQTALVHPQRWAILDPDGNNVLSLTQWCAKTNINAEVKAAVSFSWKQGSILCMTRQNMNCGHHEMLNGSYV